MKDVTSQHVNSRPEETVQTLLHSMYIAQLLTGFQLNNVAANMQYIMCQTAVVQISG